MDETIHSSVVGVVAGLSLSSAANLRHIEIPRPKDWVHAWSTQAGPKVTTILQIVQNYQKLRLPKGDHLVAVLPGSANLLVKRTGHLILPNRRHDNRRGPPAALL
jgi:hypothetical protein